MSKLLTLLFLLTTFTIQSQNFGKYSNTSQGQMLQYQIDPELENIEGSPYYNVEWLDAEVYKNESEKPFLIKEANYNQFSDDLVFKIDGQLYLAPKKEEIKKFSLGPDTFIGAYYKKGGDFGFFRLLTKNNNLKLLEKRKVIVSKGKPSKGYIQGTNDKYVLTERYYISNHNATATAVNLKKEESILKYMNYHVEKVKTYMAENKLKIKKIEDLIQIVNFYNQL